MNTVNGFLHARNAYVGALFLMALSILSLSFPMTYIGVSVKAGFPARAVGIAEICALIAASFLPTITKPHFNSAELKAPPSRRAVHSIFTALVMISPCLPAITWYLRIKWSELGYQLPGIIGFLGTPIILGSLSMLALLIAGRAVSIVIPTLVFTTIVVTQHLFPSGITAQVFATAKNWHSSWLLVSALFILTLLLSYPLASIPYRRQL